MIGNGECELYLFFIICYFKNLHDFPHLGLALEFVLCGEFAHDEGHEGAHDDEAVDDEELLFRGEHTASFPDEGDFLQVCFGFPFGGIVLIFGGHNAP